jgi:hypothetical protein
MYFVIKRSSNVRYSRMTTVTLDLPLELFQHAQHVAKASHRSVEQVVVEWIQPPNDEQSLHRAVADLDRLSTGDLIQVAQARMARREEDRLQLLLTLQQQRALTPVEYQEAERLVKQQDLQTLRKAKALYLLKKRNALQAAARQQGRAAQAGLGILLNDVRRGTRRHPA